MKAKVLQFEQTAKAESGVYARGTSGSCAGCHATEGYHQWNEVGDFTAISGVADPTPLECRACHEIHVTNTIEDYKLRGTEPFALLGMFTNNDVADMNKGNQCGKCHQARPRTYGIEIDNPGTITTGSHWGPHYGTQTNLWLGKGGFEVGGGFDAVTNRHNIGLYADACVTCHVGENANHTFAAQSSTCESCHSDVEATLDEGQNKRKALMLELAELLEAEGLLHRENADDWGEAVSGVETSHNKAGALYNYLLVKYDGSYGVHNPAYTTKLLENSINVFK
jgi:hypothetical protein